MALDELLTHLIHRNDNKMTMRFNRQAKKYGINAQAWRVLSALSKRTTSGSASWPGTPRSSCRRSPIF